jgi:hypothetical protein
VAFNKPERESSGKRFPKIKFQALGSSAAADGTPEKRSAEVEAAGGEGSSRKRQRTDSTALISAGEGVFPLEQVLSLYLSLYIAGSRVVYDTIATVPGA